MNTKQFASSLRDRNEHEAADRLEDLFKHFFETLNQRDSLRTELAQSQKQLSQAIAERTPHDYGILKEEASFLRKERDKALAEVKRVKDECANQQLNTRTEPSRLEIAAMLLAALAGRESETWEGKIESIWAIEQADALIAAAKEVK